KAVTIGRVEVFDFFLGMFPVGFLNRAEPPLHAIGIVAARVHPQDDPRAGVNELAGDDNFVPRARGEGAWGRQGLAAGEGGQGNRKTNARSGMEVHRLSSCAITAVPDLGNGPGSSRTVERLAPPEGPWERSTE